MSASREVPDAPRHYVTFNSSGGSSSCSNIQDDWNVLSCDSVERNRSRRQTKRAKSFTVAYEQPDENFGRRSSASSGLRPRSSTSCHLYVKAMNYSEGLPHYPRQLYQNPANQTRVLSTRNEYSSGQLWQESNKTLDNNPFPNKLSYSDLSQDSAYHSRHNSSVVDVGFDPGASGPYPLPGTKMHVHDRGPSWSEMDRRPTYPTSTEFATHTDEILSPRAARRIFEEAEARNAQSTRLGNRPSVATPQNYPNFPPGNPDAVGGSRYDAPPAQPQRTKSFSGLSSVTQPSRPSMHYKSSNDLSQPGGAGFRSGGVAVGSRPVNNVYAQGDPSWGEMEGGGRYPDVEGGNDRRAVKFLSQSEGEWATTRLHPKDFGFAGGDGFSAAAQEASPSDSGGNSDRNVGSARQPDGEAMGQSTGYPSNQSSVFRQLSRELYGQTGKRGVGLSGRMNVGGERQQRLGSIDENAQSNAGSGYESRIRRKSSEANRSPKGSPYGMDEGDDVAWRGRSLPPGVSPGDVNAFSDEKEEDAGDGSGFVRGRKTQLSLRKAFGIFDEFEIMDSSPRNVPRQASKSFRGVVDPGRHGSKSSLAPSDALRNHDTNDRFWQISPEDRALLRSPEAHVLPQSPQRNCMEDHSIGSSADLRSSYDHNPHDLSSDGSFGTGWQRSPVDADQSRGHTTATGSFPGSDVFPGPDVSWAIARRKSESLPRQQLSDNPGRRFSSHDPDVGILYTGTGVLRVNLIPSPENLQQRPEVRGASDGRELDRTRLSPSSTTFRSNSSNSTRATSPLPTFDNASPGSRPRITTSPSPPELPPRQYRNPDVTGENPVKEGTSELFSSNDSDVDSTLKRDTYAQQLRLEARRLSHSHSSVNALRRQPTWSCSNWKAPSSGGDDFGVQREGRYEGESGVEKLSHSYSVPSNHLVMDGRIGESWDAEQMMEFAGDESGSCGQSIDSSFRSVKNLSSEFSSEPTVNTPTEVDTRLPVTSTEPTSRSSGSSSRFQEESEEGGNFTSGHHWRTPTESTHLPTSSPPCSISSEALDAQNRFPQTFCDVQSSSDRMEAEPKSKHRLKVGIHKAGKHKDKIDTAIVLPSVRSVESAPVKDTTPPSSSEKRVKGTRTTTGKVAKVKCLPRAESTYESPASDDIQQLPEEEKHPPETSAPSRTSAARRSRKKHLQKSSTYDDPVSIVAQRLPDEEREPLTETSTLLECSASGTHPRRPKDENRVLSEESTYDRAASVVVQNLPNDEKIFPSGFLHRLPDLENNPSEMSSSVSDRLTPARSSGRFSSPLHKTAADYMSGLFTEEDDSSTVQSDTLTRNSVQRASLRNRLLVARQAKEIKERVSSSILPEVVQPLSDELRDIPLDGKSLGVDDTATTEEEKLELTRVLEKKLGILAEEKQLLHEEIAENRILGRQVTAIVEQRLEARELSKYRSYVDELEKVLYLVLKLSDRLAKAENAILALPQNASDKEKSALVSKRNDLSEKHVDALSLKEGIDRRRHQVAGYLQKCLTEVELKDYEYFIKMKAQLVIDQQEVEDKIEMGQRQLDLLRSTLSADVDSIFGPKSYC